MHIMKYSTKCAESKIDTNARVRVVGEKDENGLKEQLCFCEGSICNSVLVLLGWIGFYEVVLPCICLDCSFYLYYTWRI